MLIDRGESIKGDHAGTHCYKAGGFLRVSKRWHTTVNGNWFRELLTTWVRVPVSLTWINDLLSRPKDILSRFLFILENALELLHLLSSDIFHRCQIFSLINVGEPYFLLRAWWALLVLLLIPLRYLHVVFVKSVHERRWLSKLILVLKLTETEGVERNRILKPLEVFKLLIWFHSVNQFVARFLVEPYLHSRVQWRRYRVVLPRLWPPELPRVLWLTVILWLYHLRVSINMLVPLRSIILLARVRGLRNRRVIKSPAEPVLILVISLGHIVNLLIDTGFAQFYVRSHCVKVIIRERVVSAIISFNFELNPTLGRGLISKMGSVNLVFRIGAIVSV